MLQLGPFELIQPIGRGGMCEVWRGQHRSQGTPVAVKVVLDTHARPEHYLHTFRDEVRAMAGLQHPSIVQVYDYGQIPADLAVQSDGRLAAHSPYLVMELGDDSLRTCCGNVDWPNLYQILLSLLDALSHAHAKGVIHRDIKPGNVLLCGAQTVKLTDFGLAHAIGWDNYPEDTGEIIGTPSYMAPEQFERRWRDYGPWTDLYALGCTTYALITGEPPFGRLDNLEEMMRSHLYRPVPPLPSHCEVPPQFDQWLRCLLAKSPTARFQRAADAAWALFELARGWTPSSPSTPGHSQHHSIRAPVLPEGPLHILQSLNDASTIRAHRNDVKDIAAQKRQEESALEQTLRVKSEGSAPLPPSPGVQELQRRETTVRLMSGPTDEPPRLQVLSESPSPLFHRPPLVEDWRRSDLSLPTEMLHNVGLGLYGLRAIPWVGREAERDRLWQCLLQACRSKRPRITVLHGPAGCGKSRLAEWLGERSHEVGTALPLQVCFGPNDEHHDGFASMVSRYLRCTGLSYDECLDRLLRGEGNRLGLSRDECEALASWLSPPESALSESFSPGNQPCERASSASQAPEESSSLWFTPQRPPVDSMRDMMERYTEDPQALADQPNFYVDDDVSASIREEDFAAWDMACPIARPIPFLLAEYEDSFERLWEQENSQGQPGQSFPSFVSSERSTHRLSDPSLRYGLLLRFLQRLSHRRTLLLWLDDVHWSLDALHFVSYLLQHVHQEDFPLLIVLTVQDDILAEQKAAKKLLQQCLQQHPATSIQIGPLPDPEHSRLVRTLLGLQGELAQLVERHTAGNPLFAVQIVGDWVQRGLLDPTDQGFRLKPNVQLTIPDNLHQVWKARIERLLEDHIPQKAMLLELAAVLGHQVDMTEWRAVCQIVGEPVPLDLFEQLLEQQLVRRTSAYSDNWSFVHAMLRESLQRQAQEARRLETHHWVCATMLDRKKGRGVAERRGRHLWKANRLEEALPPLLEGIWEREEAGEYFLAEPLLVLWEELLEQFGIAPEHPYWGEYLLLKSRIARGYSDYEKAFQMAHAAYQDARQFAWERIHASSLTLLAHCGMRCGQEADAIEQWLLEAETLAQRLEDSQLLAEARWAIGEFLCLQGQWSGAEKRFQQAQHNYATHQDALGMGRSHYGLATVARQGGHFEKAQHHLEIAQRHFEACQCRRGIADCLNMLGDLCRIRGQLAPAEEHYRESIRIYKAIGAGDNAICEVNLALVLLQKNAFTEARQALEHAITTFTQNSSRMLEGAAHLCLLPCLAHTQEWKAWQHHLATARHLLTSSNFYDVDLAEVAFLAGQVAEQVQAHMRAKEAYQFALQQWEVLGHPEKIEGMRERLYQLQRKIVQTPTIRMRVSTNILDFIDPNAPTQRSAPIFQEHTLTPYPQTPSPPSLRAQDVPLSQSSASHTLAPGYALEHHDPNQK